MLANVSFFYNPLTLDLLLSSELSTAQWCMASWHEKCIILRERNRVREKIMKNAQAYNLFIQSLEKNAEGGLFFHRIEQKIYVTDHTHKLLGIWDLIEGSQIIDKSMA